MSQSKADIIEERRANLPLPEDPPTASDWNSADGRNVNVGSGSISGGGPKNMREGSDGFQEPATADSSVRTDGDEFNTNTIGFENVGRQGKDKLDGLPNDAVTRDKKNASGTVDTTKEDLGVPPGHRK
jgi:hypothetical protein